MRIAVGLLDTAVTAPPFTRKGSAWVHRAPDGRLFVVADYTKGTISVTAKNQTLGAFSEGVVDLSVTLGLDMGEAAIELQAVHSGASLKY